MQLKTIFKTILLSSTKWKLNYVLIEAEKEEIKKEYLKIAAPWATGSKNIKTYYSFIRIYNYLLKSSLVC